MSRVVAWDPTVDLGRAVVTIGVFDGVHLGHQALVADTIAEARRRDTSAVVVTFDRDPDRVVDPARAAPQLLDLDDKLAFLGELGPDAVLVVCFDRDVAAMPPDTFLETVLCAVACPAAALVGFDFRFGAGAAGDLATLASFGQRRGFEVTGHPLVRVGGAPVTSTRIRTLVAAGDVEGAAALLGRPHRVRGKVVRGRGIGVTLGAPTANLDVPGYAALPAAGVYAGRTEVDGLAYPAAVSVGVPPSFPDATSRLEVNLIGFTGDLYGRDLDLEFLTRLRDQRRIEDPDELRAAIAADIARVRELAADHRCW